MHEVVGSVLWRNLNVLQVFGANTGVGKTIISSALLRKAQKVGLESSKLLYIKPVSTGAPEDEDTNHIGQYLSTIRSKTLFKYDIPVSPHLAAKYANRIHADDEILGAVFRTIRDAALEGYQFGLVETAGGVLSPAPSGKLQADVYRHLRLPVALVGDSRLGGIGSTISAYESLFLRGYDIDGVFLFKDDVYENHDYLADYFAERDTNLYALEAPPEQNENAKEDRASMEEYYASAARSDALEKWWNDHNRSCGRRRQKLAELPSRAHRVIWHPFMQHTERSARTIVTIDSAYGDHFQTLVPPQNGAGKPTSMLRPSFDGSASWWTQGLGHGNPTLALEAAHAAGRYGHVMFANAAHEPAVSLAEWLAQMDPKIHRRSSFRSLMERKVFYTDNGSTGMEVAVKMALKASAKRYGWTPDDNIRVLGLKGSYHGDTIGVMNCSEPNIYNERVEWYEDDKGMWLDFPKVRMKDGKWLVTPPPGTEEQFGGVREFKTLADIFDFRAREADINVYQSVLGRVITHLIVNEGYKFGAVLIEPVILGAGGMLFSDPLFQYVLAIKAKDAMAKSMAALQMPALHPGEEVPADNCFHRFDARMAQHGPAWYKSYDKRKDWFGIPVITDEVFTGMYRLGQRWSSSLIKVNPDIRVTAKLLTGGLVPLAATVATEPIYEAFLSDDKADALLHGHSYTAHAVGCQVALKAIQEYESMNGEVPISASKSRRRANDDAWGPFKKDWLDSRDERNTRDIDTWSAWSNDFVTRLSFREDVQGVFALGFVLSVELKDSQGSGYSSTASYGIRERLLQGQPGATDAVHCRVLGNVLYFMASLTSTQDTLARVEEQIEWAMNTSS